MAEVNLFENYAAKDFSVLFQKDIDLDTKIDIRYIKSGEEEIKYYVDNVAMPEINVCSEKQKQLLKETAAEGRKNVEQLVEQAEQNAEAAAQSAKDANDVLLTAKDKVDEFVDNGLQQIAASLENIVTLDGEQNIIGDKTFSGLLQAMTAEKNDISNLVATTAFVNGGNVTDKGSGYIKFASGLILQWGRLVVDNTTASITYKQPFSGTSYAIATGRTSTATATNGVYTLLIRSYSTTGFKCYTVNTAAWWWIAIGF